MILYFTGTGNSAFIAEKIAEITSEKLICINDKIKNSDNSAIFSDDGLVFVLPTYAWRIPGIVRKWIEDTEFPGAEQAWFVMNCGSEIGNADKYNRQICEEKGFSYMGTAQILMPENYIAMFDAPGIEEAREIISRAEPEIRKVSDMISAKQEFPKPRCNLYDKFMSGPVNKIFYALFVKADAFCADKKCIGCGKCEQVCPLNNVTLKDGKPVWGKNCTHCMACICNCPTEAIEYGKKSVGKLRYLCKNQIQE